VPTGLGKIYKKTYFPISASLPRVLLTYSRWYILVSQIYIASDKNILSFFFIDIEYFKFDFFFNLAL